MKIPIRTEQSQYMQVTPYETRPTHDDAPCLVVNGEPGRSHPIRCHFTVPVRHRILVLHVLPSPPSLSLGTVLCFERDAGSMIKQVWHALNEIPPPISPLPAFVTSNDTRASPGQEREALLARATLSRPHRMRSGSYGSRGDLKPDSDSDRGSPQEQLLKRDIRQHGLKEGSNGGGLSGKGETPGKKAAGEEESGDAKDGSTLVC